MVLFADVAGEDEAKAELARSSGLKIRSRTISSAHGYPSVLLMRPPLEPARHSWPVPSPGRSSRFRFSASVATLLSSSWGVGASQVHQDLFVRAEQRAVDVFVDEIDAVGRQRGAGMQQRGDDERDQRESAPGRDGRIKEAGEIVIAATNRADVLDTGLLRRVASIARSRRRTTRSKRPRPNARRARPGQAAGSGRRPQRSRASAPGFTGADLANTPTRPRS